ncbi:MAG: DMT family transporter [Gammaproteobacteria bacterium]|nr:DMT family transporter [Gammaproteobacteria bacterium]
MTIKNQILGKNRARLPILENPTSLLLVSGLLIGFNFPLSKLATQAGIPAFSWIMLNALGAAAALLPALILKGTFFIPRGQTLRYTLIAGPITFAGPNLLLFLVVPHVGAGYAGIMYALSPVFTLALALLLRMQALALLSTLGIAIGLAGALGVSLSRGVSAASPPEYWLLLALLIPLMLASGNIYRTLDWPANTPLGLLVFWSNAFACLTYLLLLLASSDISDLSSLTSAPWLVAGQLMLSGMTAPLTFRLQRFGGPVILSQLGYVAAASGLIASTSLLGERYPLLTWLSAAVIAMGIAVTFYANTTSKRSATVPTQSSKEVSP